MLCCFLQDADGQALSSCWLRGRRGCMCVPGYMGELHTHTHSNTAAAWRPLVMGASCGCAVWSTHAKDVQTSGTQCGCLCNVSSVVSHTFHTSCLAGMCFPCPAHWTVGLLVVLHCVPGRHLFKQQKGSLQPGPMPGSLPSALGCCTKTPCTLCVLAFGHCHKLGCVLSTLCL